MQHRLFSLLLLSLAAPAQSITVDYPDSTLGAAAGQYPIYTGTGLNVIRTQLFCPATFAGLPATPMVCTRVGVQLAETAGPVTWAQFVVRVGKTNIPALTNTWATNLPDQTVQVDLSNTSPSGLLTTNTWVDWPLSSPFLFVPGDAVVLDITSQASVAGQYLRTAIGTGVARLVSTNYTGAATAGAPAASGGIKFRMVFEPGGLVPTGPGCAGSGSFVPAIGGIGQPTVGNQSYALTLDQGLGATLCALLMGFPASVDLGGGCVVRNSGALLLFLGTTGAGPGTGTAAFPFPIPPAAWVAGIAFDAQWAVFDPGSVSPLGVATSSSAKMLIY